MFNKTKKLELERKNKKRARFLVDTKKVENVMKAELSELLETYLFSNDSLKIEVRPENVIYFLNLVDEKFLKAYNVVQCEDGVSFIISSKSIAI